MPTTPCICIHFVLPLPHTSPSSFYSCHRPLPSYLISNNSSIGSSLLLHCHFDHTFHLLRPFLLHTSHRTFISRISIVKINSVCWGLTVILEEGNRCCGFGRWIVGWHVNVASMTPNQNSHEQWLHLRTFNTYNNCLGYTRLASDMKDRNETDSGHDMTRKQDPALLTLLMSHLCSLNILLSRNERRMSFAVRELFATPQNNLRIFAVSSSTDF